MTTFQKSMVAASIVISVCIGILIITVTVFIVREFSGMTSVNSYVTDFGETGVSSGEDRFQRELFFEEPGMKMISDIVVLGDSNEKLCIVSSEGAYYLDSELNVLYSIEFDGSPSRVERIDVESDGTPEYLERGFYSSKVRIFDSSGNVLWDFTSTPVIRYMDVCDRESDGVLEFLAAEFSPGRLNLLDAKGDVIWQKSVTHLIAAGSGDLDGDGVPELLHNDSSGSIVARDGDGNILYTINDSTFLTMFGVINWPDRGGASHIIIEKFKAFEILDVSGYRVARLDMGQLGAMGWKQSAFVRFTSDGPDYFALLINNLDADKSALFLYDETSELIYSEVFDFNAAALAALPGDDGETLLIGGTDEVWEFSLRPEVNEADVIDESTESSISESAQNEEAQ